MTNAPSFLNVTESLTGRRWEARTYDERVAEQVVVAKKGMRKYRNALRELAK
ncbi:MAG: hypothetical protein ABL897_11045 [Hyphomicrobium sp.]